MSTVHEHHEEPEEALERLREAFAIESVKDDAPASAVLAHAIYEATSADSPFTEAISYAAYLRPYSEMPEKINVVRSSVLYFADLIGYPIPETKESSKQLLDIVTSTFAAADDGSGTDHEVELTDKFREMLHEPLHTTLPSRYMLAEAILQLEPDRIPHGADFLDQACSVRQGLNALLFKNNRRVLGDKFPFPAVNVVDETGKADNNQSVALNLLVQETPPAVRQAVGIDFSDVDDPVVLAQARANLTPEERLNPELMGMYDALERADSPCISFEQRDIGKRDQMHGLLQKLGKRKFDFVNVSMVMYMLSEDERAVVLDNIPRFLRPDGRAMMAESFDVTGPNIHDVSFDSKRWRRKQAMPWTAALYDNLYPDLGWQVVAHAEDSRFLTLRLGAGHIAVGGVFRSFAEHLERRV